MTRKILRYSFLGIVLLVFLAACENGTVIPPTLTSVPISVLPTPVPVITVSPPTSTTTPNQVTPTLISAALPNNLTVAYVVEDELWIWKQNSTLLLMQGQNMSAPQLSDDGQWVLFRQRKISFDEPIDELWVVRTNGDELHRLLGPDDLVALTGEEAVFLIQNIDWLPDSHTILFNAEKIIDGPPGSWPLFDLYSVDLAGKITQLLKPGDAGRFVPSPDGVHVALVTDTRIKVFNLETGTQRTLLEFKPVGFPSDSGPATPKVVWDPGGQFVMTSILPENLYYPDKYAGEPTQIWRLFVTGQAELVAELQLVAPFTGIKFSPNLQYFFYLNNSCIDGMGMLFVHDLTSAKEHPLSCVWNLPQWMPDSEHFIYELDWLWQLGRIADNTSQPLDVLNVPADPNISASPPLTWINSEYFLLTLRSSLECTLTVATLQSVVTEIASIPPDLCPWRADFSFSK